MELSPLLVPLELKVVHQWRACHSQIQEMSDQQLQAYGLTSKDWRRAQQDTPTLKYIMDRHERGLNTPAKKDVDPMIDTRYFKYVLKRVSFGSKDCTKELKLEGTYFLGQTSQFLPFRRHQ